jgi:threonine aldolase
MPAIDLRSDTVTQPTPAMRAAMAAAVVGDDVYGEDPTINTLEERAAALLGKEAGLFVASGTMGNLVAQMAHLARGQETIASYESHLVAHEAAGHAVVVGASILTLRDRPDGTFDLDELRAAFRDPSDPHQPITGLVVIENTHSQSMARPLTVDYTRAVAGIAHEHGVPLHVDGARFFNAVVALSVRPEELAGPADSVTFCLSKGLACPVGSVVVGSRDFIWRARRARKLVGGGMRQAGFLAAAGLLALSDGPDGMIARLAEDHRNARRLAEGLAELDGIGSPGGIAQPTSGRLDPGRVVTNFVVFGVARDQGALLDALRHRGALMGPFGRDTVRAELTPRPSDRRRSALPPDGARHPSPRAPGRSLARRVRPASLSRRPGGRCMTVPSTRRPTAPAALALAAVLAVGGCAAFGPAATPTAAPTPTPAPSPTAGAAVACPTSAPPPLGADDRATVTLDTTQGKITILVEGKLAPNATGNFVALARCGFYDNVIFHRIVPEFVIQSGDGLWGREPIFNWPRVGTGGPGYTILDDPVTTPYARGVVAMARSSQPNSQGSQFFIVLDDKAAESLSAVNTYAILGRVVEGMDAVDVIAATPTTTDGRYAPLSEPPPTITKASVSGP